MKKLIVLFIFFFSLCSAKIYAVYFTNLGSSVSLCPNSVYSIQWTGTLSDLVRLEYSTDGGTNWVLITNSASGLIYDWTVPNTPSTNCIARISIINNNSITDTIKIGNQVWMTKNLNSNYYKNGDLIPEVAIASEWANLTTGGWCNYNNSGSNGQIYGKLYNWFAINDPRGLAPSGWHIPTDDEWATLIGYLGGTSVAGGKLKEAGYSHWVSPNSGATNESGFSALPSGWRINNGSYFGLGTDGDWWSTTLSDATHLWIRGMINYGAYMSRANYVKEYGFAVRCIKDVNQVNTSSIFKINQLPTAYVLTGGGSYCEGAGGVKIGLLSSESNVDYQLKLNSSDIGSSRSGNGQAIDFGFQTLEGIYTVEAINIKTFCVAKMPNTKDIVIKLIPAKPIISKFSDNLTSSANSGNQWYFNGTFINGATSKVYTAKKSGKFSVEQTQNGCTSRMSDLLDVVIDADKLIAGFNANPTTGDAPLNVSFTDASTGKTPTSWAWDFGDAGTSTQQNPTHNYTKSGSYTVKLTVSNGISNDTKSKVAFIVVSDAPNVTADLKGVPTSGEAPLSVQFTDMSTGSPTLWDWDFGDGTSHFTSQNPSHTYNTAGTYTVKLTVTKNSKQFLVTKKDYIVVSNPIDIKANFSGTPTTGNETLIAQFTDLSTGNPTAWDWDFGDGSTISTQNPTHLYNKLGIYSVRLIISKGSKKDTLTKTNYITVNSSAPLKADLVADVTIGETPLTVQFTDKSTGKPTTWSWDFGDAGTSKEQNPSHIYSKAGVYTVGLTVSDGKTIESTSKSAYITVKDVLPLKAEFSGTPVSGEIPLIVQFTDQSTGKPTIYSWEFGDGGKSSEKNPSYTYTKSGKYTVKLTVSDGKTIETNTKPDYINPTDPLPLASEFKADVTSGTAPLTVKFTDLSTGHPKIWSWDFGDGQTDNVQNPTHIYATNGTYSVKLSVSDGLIIKNQTKNAYITVGGSSGNGEGTISIKDATSNTGEIITIPIYLTDIKNITDETTGFTATLYCNATVLHPEGSTPLGIVNDSLVRIIDLSMPAKPDANGIIYNLKFLVMLGNDIGTYILIDNISPVGKNILVNSGTYSKFLISNIKTEGGVRLVVNKNKMIKLTQCDPNPASDKINLTVETNTNDVISLDLYNLFGDKVLNVFTGQLNEGQTEYKINLNSISTGSYYILLKHSDGTLSRMVQVIK